MHFYNENPLSANLLNEWAMKQIIYTQSFKIWIAGIDNAVKILFQVYCSS